MQEATTNLIAERCARAKEYDAQALACRNHPDRPCNRSNYVRTGCQLCKFCKRKEDARGVGMESVGAGRGVAEMESQAEAEALWAAHESTNFGTVLRVVRERGFCIIQTLGGTYFGHFNEFIDLPPGHFCSIQAGAQVSFQVEPKTHDRDLQKATRIALQHILPVSNEQVESVLTKWEDRCGFATASCGCDVYVHIEGSEFLTDPEYFGHLKVGARIMSDLQVTAHIKTNRPRLKAIRAEILVPDEEEEHGGPV